jgi:hypothetical protein
MLIHQNKQINFYVCIKLTPKEDNSWFLCSVARSPARTVFMTLVNKMNQGKLLWTAVWLRAEYNFTHLPLLYLKANQLCMQKKPIQGRHFISFLRRYSRHSSRSASFNYLCKHRPPLPAFQFQEFLPHHRPVSLQINTREIMFTSCWPPASTEISAMQNQRAQDSVFNHLSLVLRRAASSTRRLCVLSCRQLLRQTCNECYRRQRRDKNYASNIPVVISDRRVQSGDGNHPASHAMGNWGSSAELGGRGVRLASHQPLPRPETVELYLHSHKSSWRGTSSINHKGIFTSENWE